MSLARLLDSLESYFKESGLMASKPYHARECCFEYAVRKGEKLTLLKATVDLSRITRESAVELSLIAGKLSATPLIIAENSPKGPMGDDIAYKRYGIFAVTQKTFTRAISDWDSPIVEATPGGYFVNLDVKTLMKRMEELNLSRKELASIAGTSTKALYAHERGLTRCTLSVALRLERALGIPLVRRLELFERHRMPSEVQSELSAKGHLRAVMLKLNQLRFSVTVTKRAPFNFIAKDPAGRTLLGGLIERHEKNAEERAEVIDSIARVAKTASIIISESGVGVERALTIEKFERIKNLSELF